MSDPILVTGATGLQGGAVASALLRAGIAVRALVRDPAKPAAVRLRERGATLVRGDFADPASLRAACSGAAGVFSVQLPPIDAHDPQSEIRSGRALVDAARAEKVTTFVHTSVARAGEQRTFVGWDENRWWRAYWDSKSAVNDAVAAAGFAHYTILRPAFMMDNFAPPNAQTMFPALEHGRIETVMKADTRLDMIAVDDVGSFAAAAFLDPARFAGQAVDLAAESLTMSDVATVLQNVTGRAVEAIHLSPSAALASGMLPLMVSSQEWDDVEGYKVDIAALAHWGIPLTSFADWATRRRESIVVR